MSKKKGKKPTKVSTNDVPLTTVKEEKKEERLNVTRLLKDVTF